MSSQISTRFQVHTLEPREVLSATLLADIRPGTWGSYPRDFTASGNSVYFAATSVQGEELWVTDGTPAGTRMTADVRAGSRGSNPRTFTPAGGGVLYFVADDGTGRAYWRTDGTTTTKVSGLPTDIALDWNGHAIATGLANGSMLVVNDEKSELWWTNGTTSRLVYSALPNSLYFDPDGTIGASTTVRVYGPSYRGFQLIETDGTAVGTRILLTQRTVVLMGGGRAELEPLARLNGDRWIALARYSDNSTQLYAFGHDGTLTVLRNEPPVPNLYSPGGAAIGGAMWAVDQGKQVLFLRTDPVTKVMELWTTDGTSANTLRVTLPSGTLDLSVTPTLFDGKLIVGTNTNGKLGVILTDGLNSTDVLDPAGGKASGLVGVLSPSTRHPNGLMVLRSGNRLFASTGTQSFWLDTTGVPEKAYTNPNSSLAYQIDPYSGQGYSGNTSGVVGANGRIFFASPWAADNLPEPTAWDLLEGQTPLPPPPPPASVAPTVTAVSVNDGAVQRSMVTKVTVSFDQVVTLDTGAIVVRNLGTTAAAGVQVQTEVVNGRTVATVTFNNWDVVGGSLADGAYQLTVTGSKVRNATGGTMTANRTESFHRLFGDMNGDRTFDRTARTQIIPLLGSTRGSALYQAAFDFNSDGVIDSADEVQIVRRWGKTV